jgi:hypothetical protein
MRFRVRLERTETFDVSLDVASEAEADTQAREMLAYRELTPQTSDVETEVKRES